MSPSSTPSVASTYRLFLRALSASVLHHGPAKRSLRSIYRQPFSEAALAEQKLLRVTKTGPEDGTKELRESLQRWLTDWHKQIDSTLELLYSSATTRGVSHRVTRNLGLLAHNHAQEARPKAKGQLVWNAQYPPNPNKRRLKPQSDANSINFSEIALNPVGEAIRMAEGHSGITLGRVRNYTKRNKLAEVQLDDV